MDGNGLWEFVQYIFFFFFFYSFSSLVWYILFAISKSIFVGFSWLITWLSYTSANTLAPFFFLISTLYNNKSIEHFIPNAYVCVFVRFAVLRKLFAKWCTNATLDTQYNQYIHMDNDDGESNECNSNASVSQHSI